MAAVIIAPGGARRYVIDLNTRGIPRSHRWATATATAKAQLSHLARVARYLAGGDRVQSATSHPSRMCLRFSPPQANCNACPGEMR